MKSSCGRVRRQIKSGINNIIVNELENLKFSVLSLKKGESYTQNTVNREYAIVLVEGFCSLLIKGSGIKKLIGPRKDPFNDLPFALLISRDEEITLTALQNSLIALGSSPAENKYDFSFITPNKVRRTTRGADNWEREIRKVCWSDNTNANYLLVAETIIPSGNWGTIPPHRHQYNTLGEEACYEEIYFFRFSRQEGFGLIWQFNDSGKMDQAFSLKSNDLAFMKNGYHPVVAGPGSYLYQLTMMAGKKRISRARIHDNYKFLLQEKGLNNQFTPD